MLEFGSLLYLHDRNLGSSGGIPTLPIVMITVPSTELCLVWLLFRTLSDLRRKGREGDPWEESSAHHPPARALEPSSALRAFRGCEALLSRGKRVSPEFRHSDTLWCLY